MIGPDDLSELIPGDPYLRKRMAASNKEERQIWIKRTPDLGSPQIWIDRGVGGQGKPRLCARVPYREARSWKRPLRLAWAAR